MDHPLHRASRRAFSLVELLVVLVIVVLLSSLMFNLYLGHSKAGAPAGKGHSPMERARDTVCIENLRSVRQSIAASHAGEPDAKFPANLAEMRELPAEVRACPEGKEPYSYDPSTGQVHCVHPGHENY